MTAPDLPAKVDAKAALVFTAAGVVLAVLATHPALDGTDLIAQRLIVASLVVASAAIWPWTNGLGRPKTVEEQAVWDARRGRFGFWAVRVAIGLFVAGLVLTAG